MADEMNGERAACARAIWGLMREHEDRCDMELEDLRRDHPIWSYADAARASLAANAGREAVAWRRPDKHGGFDYEDGITSFKYDPTSEPLYTHPSPPEGMAGWISVPVEATLEMALAGVEAFNGRPRGQRVRYVIRKVWDEMIKASAEIREKP